MTWFHDELLIKLGIAALLGLIIGIERELKDKPLGLKTSAIISIVSCLLTIISIESVYIMPKSASITLQMDPLRLAAQIVSGIGFLGAGVILKRGNDHISGLTTAAIIWGAAGIGISVGAGFYYEAIAVVILIMLCVQVIPYLFTKLGPTRLQKIEHKITITVSKRSTLEAVFDQLKQNKIKVTQSRIKDLRKDSLHVLEIRTVISAKVSITELYNMISNMDDVVGIEIIN